MVEVGATAQMRVVELDMTDPTQQCPDGFKLIRRTERSGAAYLW